MTKRVVSFLKQLAGVVPMASAAAVLMTYFAPLLTCAGLGVSLDEIGIGTSQRVGGSMPLALSLICGWFAMFFVTSAATHGERMRQRLGNQAVPPKRNRDGLTRKTLALRLLHVLQAILTTGLITAAVTVYELPTARLATGALSGAQSERSISIAFLLLWLAAVMAALWALVFGVSVLLRPRRGRRLAASIVTARIHWSSHWRGTIVGGFVAVLALATVVSSSAAVAMVLQIREGRAPGMLGGLMGINITCVDLVSPGPNWPTGPLLLLGEGDKHTYFAQQGRILRLPTNLEIREIGAGACAKDKLAVTRGVNS